MNHDDASSNSMFDLPVQAKKSTAIDQVTDIELAIGQGTSSVSPLAATKDFQTRQASAETSQPLTSPVVDNFLPSPNRLLALGSLGLIGALGAGAIASTLVTHRTTINAQAVVQPVDNVQLIQSGLGGVIEAIYVQEHDILKPGQEIASFDNPSIQTKLAQIEAQIAETEEHIAQIDGQLKALEERRLAEISWLQQLTAEGLASSNNLSQFTSSRAWLLDRKNALKTRLKEQRNQLERTQQQVDGLIIRSPKEGSIYGLELDRLGQAVSANETIAKIVPSGVALEVKALIPETQIKNVEVGYPARINLSQCAVLSFGSLPGQVTSVEPVSPDIGVNLTQSATSPEKIYRVAVETNAKSLHSSSHTCELLPGMEGELTIITKQEKLLHFFLRKLRLKASI